MSHGRPKKVADLLQRELWCSSPGGAAWLGKVTTHARSVATASMLGHVLGLGDRHLDNVLVDLRSGEGPRLTLAAKSLFARLKSAFPRLRLLGHPDRRLPGQLSLNHPGLDAQQLLCDCPDLAFSMSSACHSDIPLPSRVMLAIGLTPEQAASTFRLHIGRFNESDELERACRSLIAAMQRQFPRSP